ncbi:nickel/cobalt transporter [Actinosynnema sp. CA-248983]
MKAPAALLLLLTALGLSAVASPAVAVAHPLGNFTVNHHHAITARTDGIEVASVVDIAEIPTAQERPAEVDGYAERECGQLRRSVAVEVDGRAVDVDLWSSTVEFPAGEAGLATTRLSCLLHAPVEVDRGVSVRVRDGYRADRIGWREMTAVGAGVAVSDSSVPMRSVSDALMSYPDDLLADPLDVRSATFRVEPGVTQESGVVAASDRGSLLTAATRAFTDLAGQRDLTALVGVLAVLLAILLGASHAALPGHGKTVIAAYLAGRDGTARDAMVVGATVTATHTAGVLVIGLLISTSSTMLGESALRLLGVASGLLVAAIGAVLLRSALRQRHPALVGHHHGQGHSHGHGHGHGHGHRVGRAGLVGMGVAGGLVPSPSALVVLLGAVALGRTWFGVLLVLGYGLGMAATLTAVGLLLVRLRDRLAAVERLRDRFTALPALTAGLVLVVGLGLAARAILG